MPEPEREGNSALEGYLTCACCRPFGAQALYETAALVFPLTCVHPFVAAVPAVPELAVSYGLLTDDVDCVAGRRR